MKIRPLIALLSLTLFCCAQTTSNSMNKIRYVALGDSYTICEGASTDESWPVIMTKHLNEKKIPVELIANPWANEMFCISNTNKSSGNDLFIISGFLKAAVS